MPHVHGLLRTSLVRPSSSTASALFSGCVHVLLVEVSNYLVVTPNFSLTFLTFQPAKSDQKVRYFLAEASRRHCVFAPTTDRNSEKIFREDQKSYQSSGSCRRLAWEVPFHPLPLHCLRPNCVVRRSSCVLVRRTYRGTDIVPSA